MNEKNAKEYLETRKLLGDTRKKALERVTAGYDDFKKEGQRFNSLGIKKYAPRSVDEPSAQVIRPVLGLFVKRTLTNNVLNTERSDPVGKELQDLGKFVMNSMNNVQFIQGPLKGIERLEFKTRNDYGGLYGENKDIVRGTIACESPADLHQVVALLQKTCTPEYGMAINGGQPKIKVAGEYLGYTDTTFIVIFKGLALGGELQCNTKALLYAKMSKDSYIRNIGCSVDEYVRLSKQFGAKGGLGHVFYNIHRAAESPEADKSEAAALSAKYYSLINNRRGHEIVQDLKEFGDKLQSTKNKKEWSDAYNQLT
jgi:hypothetical protein